MPDVVLPVLNEAEAIPWVLTRMPSTFSPIVVDNGSTDGSDAVARAHGARVLRETRRGFGAACFAGLTAARSDIVCFMDCDASLDPRDLPLVVRPLEEGRADLVLGARNADTGSWPLHGRIANKVVAGLASRRTRQPFRDIGPMRAAARKPLLALGIRDRRSGWPLEMVLRAARAGWFIEEVDVPYLRRKGRSKVTGTARGTLTAVRDMARVLR